MVHTQQKSAWRSAEKKIETAAPVSMEDFNQDPFSALVLSWLVLPACLNSRVSLMVHLLFRLGDFRLGEKYAPAHPSLFFI